MFLSFINVYCQILLKISKLLEYLNFQTKKEVRIFSVASQCFNTNKLILQIVNTNNFFYNQRYKLMSNTYSSQYKRFL